MVTKSEVYGKGIIQWIECDKLDEYKKTHSN